MVGILRQGFSVGWQFVVDDAYAGIVVAVRMIGAAHAVVVASLRLVICVIFPLLRGERFGLQENYMSLVK